MKTLAYIVASVMTDIQSVDEKHFIRFLKWAIDGYRKLNLHGIVPSTRTVELPIYAPTNSVELPSDFIDYLKIGICVNGYLINFDLNRSICTPAENETNCPCDSETIETAITNICNGGDCDVSWTYPDARCNNGIYTAGIYGMGSSFYGGGYKLDRENNRIIFDSYVQGIESVLLEYKSSGIKTDGTAFVPEDAIPALSAYVNWQRCLFSTDSADRQVVRMHEQRFKDEAMSMLMRKNAMTESEWLYLFRENVHQGIKR